MNFIKQIRIKLLAKRRLNLIYLSNEYRRKSYDTLSLSESLARELKTMCNHDELQVIRNEPILKYVCKLCKVTIKDSWIGYNI
jgi:hypothetical protein